MSRRIKDRFLLLQQAGKSLHHIRDEITHWREILEIPYQESILRKEEAGVPLRQKRLFFSLP